MYPQISKSLLMAFTRLILSTTALPTETATFYPEVIPGPGMPSLAELGLTSEQLYTTTPNLHCPNALANVDSVIACFNYLMSLGTSGCGVDRYNGKRFCTSGNAKVDGLNYTPGQANPTKSYWLEVHKRRMETGSWLSEHSMSITMGGAEVSKDAQIKIVRESTDE
ncbi:hypothetical protein ACEPPN_013484 [Leptodophora sp. 'Broadleaf-Isolate-01']